MKQNKIDASKLYADIKIEGDVPAQLVFYETDKNYHIIHSWGTDSAIGYQVKDGVINCPKILNEERVDEDNIAHLQIPLYNIALYFFNHKMIGEEELYQLEEKLVKLYEIHRENFSAYIEETFAFTEFKQTKYFYSDCLIQELRSAFQMMDRLNQADKGNCKKLVLNI